MTQIYQQAGNMTKSTFLVLWIVCFSFGIVVSFSSIPRLPSFASTPLPDDLECFQISERLEDDVDIPLRLSEYINVSIIPSDFFNITHKGNKETKEFVKGFMYELAYETFFEYIVWLDNLLTVVREILLGEDAADYRTFDNSLYRRNVLKSSYFRVATILDGSSKIGGKEKALVDAGLAQLPFAVYQSLYNTDEEQLMLGNDDLNRTVYEKITSILSLFENSTYGNGYAPSLLFNIDIIGVNLDAVLQLSQWKHLDLSIIWTGGLRNVCINTGGGMASGDIWPREDINYHIDKISNNITAEAIKLRYFIEGILMAVADGNSNCTDLQCWTRNPTTGLLWPAWNSATLNSYRSFVLHYLNDGSMYPVFPISTPNWVREYISVRSNHSVNLLDLDGLLTLQSLFPVYEATFQFVSWLENVQIYTGEFITGHDQFHLHKMLTESRFYQEFMEIGYYLIQYSDNSNFLILIHRLANDLFVGRYQQFIRNSSFINKDRDETLNSILGISYEGIFEELYQLLTESLTYDEESSLDLNSINFTDLLSNDTLNNVINLVSGIVEQQGNTLNINVSQSIRAEFKEIQYEFAITSVIPSEIKFVLDNFQYNLEQVFLNVSLEWSSRLQNIKHQLRYSQQCSERVPMSKIIFKNLANVSESLCWNSWYADVTKVPFLHGSFSTKITEYYVNLPSQNVSSLQHEKRIFEIFAYQILFTDLIKYKYDLEELKSSLHNSTLPVSLDDLLCVFQNNFLSTTYQLANSFKHEEDFREFSQTVGLLMIQDEFNDEQIANFTAQTLFQRFDLNVTDVLMMKENRTIGMIEELFENAMGMIQSTFDGCTILLNYSITDQEQDGLLQRTTCYLHLQGLNETFGSIEQVLQDFSQQLTETSGNLLRAIFALESSTSADLLSDSINYGLTTTTDSVVSLPMFPSSTGKSVQNIIRKNK